MRVGAWFSDARLRVAALVCACFLLGSNGWIAWLYRITSLADPAMVDVYTMVFGYLVQALGIGMYMLVRCRARSRVANITVMAAIALYVLLMEPATMAGELHMVLALGYTMCVFCGYFQGHYLTCLAEWVGFSSRGTVFGTGYAVSTLLTWLLSSVSGGLLITGAFNMLVSLFLALVALLLVHAVPNGVACASETSASAGSLADAMPTRAVFMLAGAAVVLASLVKNAGFSFPASDLSGVVNLELSRLFYGIGLIAAGIVADRKRVYALACCGASMVMPFLMLALSGAAASGVTLWALGYLLFGFFSVWRVVLFADLADCSGRVWLAGFGLLLGRIGDAAGTALCVVLADQVVVLIGLTSVLFIVAAVLLFALYGKLYSADANREDAEEEDEFAQIERFCKLYGLSNREQEVLFFLVDGSGNARIARELNIAEPTVKFHVRNILKKTACANRVEVARLFSATAKGRRS